MDPDTQRALDAIDRVCENPSPVGPLELDPEYLRLIELVEALPQNQDGADKTHVERARLAWNRHYRSVVRCDE